MAGPELKLKGVEIEKGTPMEVAEKFVGNKSMIVYSETENRDYAGMKPKK